MLYTKNGNIHSFLKNNPNKFKIYENKIIYRKNIRNIYIRKNDLNLLFSNKNNIKYKEERYIQKYIWYINNLNYKQINTCLNNNKYIKNNLNNNEKNKNFNSVNFTNLRNKYNMNNKPNENKDNLKIYLNKPKQNNENILLKNCQNKYKFEEFSIFSFNILANSLVDYKYNKNNPNVLNWLNRKKSIYANIKNNLSDIICLQEIEEQFYDELKIELEKLNYKGLFLKKKTETSKDGICIFYNTSIFELLFFDEITFNKSLFLKKWQVGLIVALKNVKTKYTEYYENCLNENIRKTDNENKINTNINNIKINDIIIISNTHLIFDYIKGDIKLYQLCYLTFRIIVMLNKCKNYLKKKNEQFQLNNFIDPCIILCGDFNFTPNSLLYYFIINRFINLKNINLEFLSGQYLMFKKEYYFNCYQNGKDIKNIFDENITSDLINNKKKNIDNIKKEELFHFFQNKNILNEEYITNIFENTNDGLIDYNINLNQITENRKENEIKNECINKEQEEDFILYYPLYFKSSHNVMLDNIRKDELYYKYDNIEQLNNQKNNELLDNIPFTVYHDKQKGCVDYIFYTYKNLQVISYNKLPSFEKLSKYGCLPNNKYSSSDHLYLYAKLIRKNYEDKQIFNV